MPERLGEGAFRRWLNLGSELRALGVKRAVEARLHHHAGTAELADSVRPHYRAVAELSERVERLEGLARIPGTSGWIAQAELRRSPLISVIVPTRDRRARLERAVGSVLAQSYPNWELVVVDDGGDREPAEWLSGLGDARIRTRRIDHRGASAARNAGLAMARGELIAYMDDDNTMHSGWLKAVAWAFERRPETDVLYGAIVIDDVGTPHGFPATLPTTILNPFDRERLAEENLADMSQIAHRAGLAEARFDESLRTMADWDLLARLTSTRDPLVLPAVACFYTTDAPSRLTGSPSEDADAEAVRARARSSRADGASSERAEVGV